MMPYHSVSPARTTKAMAKSTSADDRPGKAQHRLLVADGDLAPRQEVEQIAILPQLAQVEPQRAAVWLDRDDGRGVARVLPGGPACRRRERRVSVTVQRRGRTR